MVKKAEKPFAIGVLLSGQVTQEAIPWKELCVTKGLRKTEGLCGTKGCRKTGTHLVRFKPEMALSSCFAINCLKHSKELVSNLEIETWNLEI